MLKKQAEVSCSSLIWYLFCFVFFCCFVCFLFLFFGGYFFFFLPLKWTENESKLDSSFFFMKIDVVEFLDFFLFTAAIDSSVYFLVYQLRKPDHLSWQCYKIYYKVIVLHHFNKINLFHLGAFIHSTFLLTLFMRGLKQNVWQVPIPPAPDDYCLVSFYSPKFKFLVCKTSILYSCQTWIKLHMTP